MLLQIPCPKCGAITDVEPNASAACAQCGTAVVGWAPKSGRSKAKALSKNQKEVDPELNKAAFLFGCFLIASGVVCAVFFSFWMGLIIVGLGAILIFISEK